MARKSRGRYAGELILLVIVFMWGLGYTANRYAVTHGWEPLVLPTFRLLVGAPLFVALALWLDGSLRMSRRDLRTLTFGSLALVLVNLPTFHYSVRYATASTVALIFGTLPVFAALVSQAIGFERLRRKHWVATAVSFSGVALVAVGTGGAITGSVGGILLALAASVSFAVYSVLIATLGDRYSPWRIFALVMVIGLVPSAALAAPKLATLDLGLVTPLGWGAAGYTFFMFFTTTVLWYVAMKRVGAAHAALWANLQPFTGVLFGVLILSETLAPLEIVGAVVIAASILLARWRRASVPPVE
jgi:drug/metabolite transporter (DMT)-like permease